MLSTKKYIAICILFAFSIKLSYAGVNFDKNKCTIDLEIQSTLSVKDLLNIFFNTDSLKMTVFNVDEIKVLEKRENEYLVEYSFKYLTYKSKATYLRKLNIVKGMIELELKSFTQSNSSIPRMLISKGYYQFTDNGKTRTIHFFRETFFDKKPGEMDRMFMKEQTEKYSLQLSSYLRKLERQAAKKKRKAK
jgi:uncharacterized ubiquitin-like protein YukD